MPSKVFQLEDLPDDLCELPEDADVIWKHDDDEFSDESIWDNLEGAGEIGCLKE